MNILTKIVEKKVERLHAAKRAVSLRDLKDRISGAEPARDFRSAVTRNSGPVRLIAELKKASPSKGLIRADFDPVEIATIYQSAGASAISVLTEEDFFQGNLSYIAAVKNVVALPLLRKDFIFDEYQVYEARANRADAILLIASILDKAQAKEYMQLAASMGMAVLFEVHNEDELEKALLINAGIIGINNRDLKTMEIDLATTLRLKKQISSDHIVVSESGISARQDVLTLEQNGIDAMLVGTSFMKSADVAASVRNLLQPDA